MSVFVSTGAKGVLQIQGVWKKIHLHVMGSRGRCCVNTSLKLSLSGTGMPQLKAGPNVAFPV